MPTTYTHYRFGRDVYKSLPAPLQDIIRSHGGLYNIGLHGPDLLFYYKVYKKNRVNQIGFSMHDLPARGFFEQAAQKMHRGHRIVRRRTSIPFLASAKYAYLFGFLCHFALDSACHPFIEQMVREKGISHSEIEAELDRDYMLLDGLDPMACRPTAHLRARPFYGNVIARFFPELTAAQILGSIRSMRFCCNMLAPSGQRLRGLVQWLMKGTPLPMAVKDMIIKKHPNPVCAPMIKELRLRYKKAVTDASELIVNFVEHVENGVPLDKRLDHTFGEH